MQRTLQFLAGLLALSAVNGTAATPDLPSCDVWSQACHYTVSSRESSYDINRVVIHKTQGGTAAGAASWFANCASGGSAHFSFDKANGQCYQSVLEKDIAWHAGYGSTNNNSIGIEHSGWVNNNDTSTACYNESAIETRSAIVYYGVPWNRNYIIGHSEVPGCSSTAGGVNCHTDPGPHWNWTYYMAQCNPGPTVINPSYLFGGGVDGWTPGNGSSSLGWSNSGWPGVAYADQLGNDMFWLSPATNYGGGADPSMNVQVHVQNGSSAAHTMQMFWKTNAENFWDAAKSTPKVSYSAANGNWISLNLSLNNNKYWWQTINQLRLDFDDTNVGTRFLVNHVYLQTTPRDYFPADTEGWTAANGLTAPWWYNTGWPGVIVTDQVGVDAHMHGPTFNIIGGSNDVVTVRLYPQNGTTANHNMQVFFKTESSPSFTEAKSSGIVNYTAQNQWITLTFPVGQNGNWPSQRITQLRLDFDHATNSQTRYIVDQITVDHAQ